MPMPVEISYRDMDPSPALNFYVHRWAAKLALVHPDIARCRVTIERPHQHKRHGQPVRVRVDLTVPGPDVTISHDRGYDHGRDRHEDAYVAVHDAFTAAQRRLKQSAHKLRDATSRRPSATRPPSAK